MNLPNNIDLAMLTTTNMINKQSHAILGIVTWEIRLLITLAISCVINSLNFPCIYSQIAL